jgi:hypothetical protein
LLARRDISNNVSPEVYTRQLYTALSIAADLLRMVEVKESCDALAVVESHSAEMLPEE